MAGEKKKTNEDIANDTLEDAKSARKEFQALSKEYSDYLKGEGKKITGDFEKTAKGNVGQAGYNKTLGMASKGANLLAGGAQQQAQNAYRAAGLSKAQAAQLAGGQANQAYQQGFSGQQGQAASQLGQLLNTASTLANQRLGTANNVANLATGNAAQSMNFQGNLTGQTLQNAQQQYKNKMDLVGKILESSTQLVGQPSDRRLKTAVNLDSKKSARDCCNRVGEIMNSHKKKKNRSYKDLMF